jgi:hypothetical protein
VDATVVPDWNGVVTIIINVTDSGDLWTLSNAFDVTVDPVNDPPEITTTNDEEALEDELYTVAYTATDVDSTGLNWSLDTNATFLGLDQGTGNLSGTPVNEDVGAYFVNMSISDGDGGGDFTYFILTVLNVNDAPFWTDTPTDVELDIGQEYTFDVNASDVDVGDVLAYKVVSFPLVPITIQSTTGILSWTPESSGTHIINVSATDGVAVIHHEFDITVITPNAIPTATLVSPLNNSELSVINPTFQWLTQDGDGDNVTCDLYLSGSIQDVRDRASSCRLVSGSDGTLHTLDENLEKGKTYHWTVIPSDGEDTGTCTSGIWTFTIEQDAVVNLPPEVDSVKDQTVKEGNLVSLQINDTDTDLLTYEVWTGPANSSIDENGLFTWQTGDGDNGTYDITIRVSDGNSVVEVEFEIEVLPPEGVITPPPDDDVVDDDIVVPDDDVVDDDIDDDVVDDDDSILGTSQAMFIFIPFLIGLILIIVVIVIIVVLRKGRKDKERSEEEVLAQETLSSPDALDAEVEGPDIFQEKMKLDVKQEVIQEGMVSPVDGGPPPPPDDMEKPPEEEVLSLMPPEIVELLTQLGYVKGYSKRYGEKEPLLALPPAKIFDTQASGLPKVDDLFIITKTGMLVKHFSYENTEMIDTDVLAAMLTVIQNFVADSFTNKNTALKELRLGEMNILITPGNHISVVALSSEENMKPLERPMNRMIHEIELINQQNLTDWDGIHDTVIGLDDCVEKLINDGY